MSSRLNVPDLSLGPKFVLDKNTPEEMSRARQHVTSAFPGQPEVAVEILDMLGLADG